MNEERPWHEQDDWWETVAPVLFHEGRVALAAEEVDKILSLLEVGSGSQILDLCCGVGRHSLELARRGFRVTGVDRTRQYLDRASERAEAEGLRVELVQDDMRIFCRMDAFDAVINVFTSFGYFEDPNEDRQVAANAYRSLRRGGVFLLDLMGKEIIARIFRERDWREVDGMLVLEERKVTRDWSWMDNRWILIRDGVRKDLHVSHRLYSAAELVSLLASSGFVKVDIYGDYERGPYDHTATRLVAVAHK